MKSKGNFYQNDCTNVVTLVSFSMTRVTTCTVNGPFNQFDLLKLEFNCDVLTALHM